MSDFGEFRSDEFKRIEEYMRRKEEEYKRRVEEDERRRKEAIQFLLENSFILGTATDDELSEIIRHRDRIEQIRRLRGIDFRVFTWDGKIIAIPSEAKASFSININEILKHAKRFGESLLFFEEVDA